MLDKMREGSQGIVAKSILVVIILSFALAGVSSYIGGTSEVTPVTVNGEGISSQRIEQAYQNERARLQQQYGQQFELLASTPGFAQQIRAQATQGLITDRLIAQAVEEMGLRVSDEEVKDTIRNTTDFQTDGKFNNNLYLSILRNNNLSPEQYSTNLKASLVRLQLLETLVGSEFVLPSEVEQVAKLQSQERVARFLNIQTADFGEQTVTDQEVEDFYNENTASFESPEQFDVEYVLLDAEKLATNAPLTEEEIETYYDQHKDEYTSTERRKVAHIFIEGVSDESKQKAEAIAAEIKAGANFEELARTESEDTFSAQNDGELDWFERGVMDPAFDQAAFALNTDAPISDVVQSDFGFHIIKLIDAENGDVVPLSEVKSKIEVALNNEKQKSVYDTLYQNLSDVAFESPDSLDEASKEVGVDIVSTGLFTAEDIPEQLDVPAIRSQIFDQDFRIEGLNSEVIELNATQSIVVRIKEYKEAATQPLKEVSDIIALQLKEQKAADAAQAFAQSLIVKLNNGESIDAELEAKDISFTDKQTLARYSQEADSAVVQRLFTLSKPAQDQVVRDYVVTGQGNVSLIELFDVVAENEGAEPAAVEQITSFMERSVSETTYQSLAALLLENADVEYAGQ
ncbi:SurA N-terminal domain-containing protein [Psychromonas aquatilis]|uniref:Periplasmic chaperone PpiD n=1 Tax=Psychromonas aquatilis TaxID=2005072 RepID=A0ABU9GTR2_9GAMM